MLSSFVRGDQLLLRVPGVLTIGSPMVDLIAHVDEKTLQRLGAVRSSAIPVTADHFSQILGKLRRPVKRAVGGSAANVACALARMSGRTSFIGRIGTDHEGIYCRDVLKEEGVNVWISVDLEKPTGRVLVLVTPDGERSMISCLGASENFNVNELTGLEFHQMGIVHIEGYHLSHFEATLRLMQMAKGQGARISIDLASVEWV
jgi:sugar/nucleoside kinase (ribokinase family)